MANIQSEDDFKTISKFPGYENKPEITNISPAFLVKKSQNVLIDYANHIVSRPGYTLFGAANNGGTGIKGSYEWETSTGQNFPVRCHDGDLEFWWNGTWNLLQGGYATSYLRFANVVDNDENIDMLMYVMGNNNMYKWSGGVAKIAAAGGSITILPASGLTAYSQPTGSAIFNSNLIAPIITEKVNNSALGLTADGTITGSTSLPTVQPAAGQSFAFYVPGALIYLYYVNSISGAQAGSVLIGATLSETILNTNNLLANPGVTNSTQVAFSSPNQTSITNYATALISTMTANISLPSLPTNGQTITFNINGTAVTITWVTAIGAAAGNVLIGATTVACMANLYGLLSAPSITNSTQVALSSGNQTLVGYLTYANSVSLTKQGVMTNKSTIAFVAGTPGTVAATITDSNNGFLNAGFEAGDDLYVIGSTSNTSIFTIGAVTAGTITLIMSDVLVSEVAGQIITLHTGYPTWASARFLTENSRAILYNGISYGYTGGENTDTLTGLPSFPTFNIGDPVWQQVIVVTNVLGLGTNMLPTPTITIANPAVITCANHGLQIGSTIFFTEDITGVPPASSQLPTGILPSTPYYVVLVVDANNFQISATVGGSALTTSGSQSGTFTMYQQQSQDFYPDLIGVQANQLIIASTKSRYVYMSSVEDYTNFIPTSPRAQGDPAYVILDALATCIVPVDNVTQTISNIVIGGGKDEFYQIAFKNSADQSEQQVIQTKFKTASGSGLISKGAFTPIKNSTAYISREPVLDLLSDIEVVDGKKNVPLSDIIKNDFDAYDFTDAHVRYWKRAIYIALPAEGLVLIYDLMRNLWQPPQTMPISRLAIIDDMLYGHSSLTNETYQLFTGTSDNGNFINQVARFAYNNGGSRNLIKTMTEQWTDGYISPNGTLNINLYFGFNGADGKKNFSIAGDDPTVADLPDASPLGTEPMGSLQGLPFDNTDLPGLVRFWQIDTMSLTDFTEMFVEYTMNTLNAAFALVAYGNNMVVAETSPNSHKK